MRQLRRKLALAGGLAGIGLALSPPLADAARHLFAAHMVQHLLLIALAAPLLAASRVFEPLQKFSPIRQITQPVTAWIAFVGIFLFWHWPTAFRWAAGHEASRLLEYGSILLGALLFWSAALSARGQEWLSYGGRALMTMTAAVAIDLPGVIMVFSPRAIATMPGEDAARWGLNTLQDQQIAGLLMWVPANLVFFGVATWLFALWISDDDKYPSQVTT